MNYWYRFDVFDGLVGAEVEFYIDVDDDDVDDYVADDYFWWIYNDPIKFMFLWRSLKRAMNYN